MTAPASQRLSSSTLAGLPGTVLRPAYDRDATRIGIVHLGVGAFHRAHQAVYVEDLLALDARWAICGVSLNSRDVREALQPQEGLYTLALLGETTQMRVIGSVREVLAAREQGDAVLARLSHPDVRLVTLTITEKGYCLKGEHLDLAHADIVRDLTTPRSPVSAVGYLVEGLRRRRDAGLPPYTVLSCDNLPDNGGKLRRAVLQFAERIDEELALWIAGHATFPRSMVDSITPATDDALRERVAQALGCADAWPVQRERYTQWVVEDAFCNGRPPLDRVGVTFSDEIAGYDKAKLRLLNAPHSALAYLGSLMNVETVAQAMATPVLASFVERLMRDSIAPNVAAPRGFDAQRYAGAILERFRNPAIQHRLLQIAWDGSQKIPVRLLGTITDALAAGRPIDRLCLPVAGWMQFVRRQANAGVALVDPLNDALVSVGAATTGYADADVRAFLSLESVFAPLSGDARFVAALRSAYAVLGDASPDAVEQALADA
ncbi:mannitol dehydrogenase family protein [Lysobacter sp. LF1]|uniref:Mannitol dehydrogenase family protein n=1 Tax=Lysobacter stagni TaxID=3045172 RepID=A0ABT6XE69_9GAMM|nr:mannitol dehydrogenase family protein [Lysobacter sp. LF1]MDI9238439.1 mannitol dehydrogenase family protein [Lysobacter sp. LF1]